MEGIRSDEKGPDLSQGVPVASVQDGASLKGHVGAEPVLLVRLGEEFFAIGGACSHYGGPLSDGVIVGDSVRCPWHHACFNLRTGEAVRPPAIDPVACWFVERRDDSVYVRGKVEHRPRGDRRSAKAPRRVVIIGGGAAGFAAAELLVRRDFSGDICMLSDDDAPPVDRPNLSKDYLAGNAPEEWIPLRDARFYEENNIDLRLNVRATGIDPRARTVALGDGSTIKYDRLLLATGAEPVRLALPGMDLPHVHTLRTLGDCRAILARAATSQRAVVLGASFIGLEVAAALRTRGIDVHVVAPDKRPMERVLGAAMGDFVRQLHEEHGVVFHLEELPAAIERNRVILKSGGSIDADLVVVGVGVRPRLELVEQAGLTSDRGVRVDEYLETSAPGILAAGDIARWPDPHTNTPIRVEHWVVAQRQGQTAACNILGDRQRFDAVPFFWSQHYDVPINYVGHAERWDDVVVDGDIAARDCEVRYMLEGRVLAVATINRDPASLSAEAAMERRR